MNLLKVHQDKIWFLARIFLGLVFAYAGFLKAAEPIENFQAVVLDYEVFPYVLSKPIAYIVPWLEVVFGVFVIVGFKTRFSSLFLGLFAASFVVLIAVSYLKLGGFPESCGCFGEGGIKLKPYQVIVLDLVNAFIGFSLWKRTRHFLALDNYFAK